MGFNSGFKGLKYKLFTYSHTYFYPMYLNFLEHIETPGAVSKST